MISDYAIKEGIEKIKRMPIEHLFEYGQKLFVNIKIYEEQDRTERFFNEIESDRNYLHNCFLEAVIEKKKKKKYGITDYIERERVCFYATFGEFLNGIVSRCFLHSMQKDNVFCRKVVAHYILKNNPELKPDIEKEVDKWIDNNNSEEFRRYIASDVFTLCHYKRGISKMVEDYLQDILTED